MVVCWLVEEAGKVRLHRGLGTWEKGWVLGGGHDTSRGQEEAFPDKLLQQKFEFSIRALYIISQVPGL